MEQVVLRQIENLVLHDYPMGPLVLIADLAVAVAVAVLLWVTGLAVLSCPERTS